MAENPTPIELQKYLSGVDYPASRDELVRTARDQGAPDDVIEALEQADQDEFDGPTAVSSAVSGD
ncbi:DUF2795 domain-containing protein [Plantibacter cousiniae (nom. nud.)]|uniref:DUF2795 domain-containing protein n=1 Tax=Plantibacter cousiniae (nom. nud.) TaxID=199709 RepID=A0ABY1LL94_9MICO|nr:DUF2795 domain-containing protein [Plantibacter cousiniae]SKC42328.1 Protein of unknown function [Plantibacter cousiniae]